MSKPKLNCAIYTRKSTDEGLEQSFNSLDAQREACEAYILSQKHEGWHALPILYDDGGYSGGNTNRPALQKLLIDIQVGKVNVVIVYKVDRLTRSLADFAKIVEQFDKQGVSFVSVTQQFNTTSSMGRLTLNVLLSFAQFEREVIGERVRDKIAASKAKGMWMGGGVPLGYAAEGRTLVPVPKETKIVRYIYKRYLAIGNVRELEAELKRDNIRGKIRRDKTEGVHLSRSALYHLLQNPIYIGLIRHHKKTHKGQHKPIVPEESWRAVQEKIGHNRVDRPNKIYTSLSLLTGFVFDTKGEKLSPTSTLKGGRRYRYYIQPDTIDLKTRLRIPAGELDELIIKRLYSYLQKHMPEHAEELLRLLESEDVAIKKSAVTRLVRKVILHASRITIHLRDGESLSFDYVFSKPTPYRRMATDDQPTVAAEGQKQALLKAYLQGYIWRRQFFEMPGTTVADITRLEGKGETYVTRLIHFSLMAPDLVARILKGDIPAHVNRTNLVTGLPASWTEQRRRFEQHR